MAGSLCDYTEDKWNDHILKVASFIQPSLWLALSTTDPLDTGAGITEPIGSGYARKSMTAFDAAGGTRATENTNNESFPQASGAWGTIAYWCLFDASTAGNPIAHGDFTVSKAIVSGNIVTVNAGDLDISVDSGTYSNYLSSAMLDHTFLNGAFTVPTNIYVGFSTADPTDDASGNAEPGAGNYSRTLENTWDASSSGASANTGAISSPVASGSWGTITHATLWDTATVGNMLMYGTITPSQAVTTNDNLEYAAGDFDLTVD